jgi:hypothetical protein
MIPPHSSIVRAGEQASLKIEQEADKTGQHLFAKVWDRQSIYRCITRATQLPRGEQVREWYNDYAIFLSTYAKDITPESEEDEFFVLCATYTGFILPYERLKAWLIDHHQDTTLADEIFTGLIAEVTQQESQESDNEFVQDPSLPPLPSLSSSLPSTSKSSLPSSTQEEYRKKQPTPISSSTNGKTSPHSSSSKRIIYPYEIKTLIDSTLYFLDRDTIFSSY